MDKETKRSTRETVKLVLLAAQLLGEWEYTPQYQTVKVVVFRNKTGAGPVGPVAPRVPFNPLQTYFTSPVHSKLPRKDEVEKIPLAMEMVLA